MQICRWFIIELKTGAGISWISWDCSPSQNIYLNMDLFWPAALKTKSRNRKLLGDSMLGIYGGFLPLFMDKSVFFYGMFLGRRNHTHGLRSIFLISNEQSIGYVNYWNAMRGCVLLSKAIFFAHFVSFLVYLFFLLLSSPPLLNDTWNEANTSVTNTGNVFEKFSYK